MTSPPPPAPSDESLNIAVGYIPLQFSVDYARRRACTAEIDSYVSRSVAKAVEEERETCAAIADRHAASYDGAPYCDLDIFADDIRARSRPSPSESQ